ncbi:GDP-mannose 4,6-dehydratase [Desulfobacula phenolica]|uniref:dTDP-glucose 4,6-dehydratase n=1 Tax=Desulfobacula phenolica TaxID=90732 RepID=A0A1H2DS30_9BACT|nr:GDP-mannose 4,6-dehydratase [Desulfobacula phenolica]SDT85626.1 dTDP-glucose 4,6-dehydratase [Desulfobacula phenolica]
MQGFSKKVLVLGSNSFSGSHFVDAALNQGMNIVGISRSKELATVFLPYKWKPIKNNQFSFFQYDLNHDLDRILEIIFDYKPDYIVNFAAQGMVAESWDNPDQWFMTNTLSAVKLHQRLKDCVFLKKFVQVSTPEVYGSSEGNVKESKVYNPSTPYAVSKAAIDMSLMTFFRQYNFPVVFTRSSNVYGPGQQLYRIVPKAILFFKTGRKLELHGGGRSVRSFIHIKDVVQGTLKAMHMGKPGKIYHFSTSDPLSIRSLVKMIAKHTGVLFNKNVIDVNDRSGKDKAYLLDDSRTSGELGWQAEISLELGIKETIEWINHSIDDLKKEKFEYVHTQ